MRLAKSLKPDAVAHAPRPRAEGTLPCAAVGCHALARGLVRMLPADNFPVPACDDHALALAAGDLDARLPFTGQVIP